MKSIDPQNIFIIIAVYNEARSFPDVLDSIGKYGYTIVVVDDGSEDGSAIIAESCGAVVLRHIINLGQGAALQTGIEYARLKNAPIVVTYDADGQFEASEITRVVAPLLKKEADVVLGSRFLGNVTDISFFRKMVLKIGIMFTYIFSNIYLTDTHNGFRAFNRKSMEYITITHNRMSHASEILDKIKKNNLKYIEVPVSVRYHSYAKSKGQSTMNFINIISRLIFDKLI